jgi:Predicted oxidoreductases (related to aryl-alcohol dehydrogenases)
MSDFTPQQIPRRPFGSAVGNPNLPNDVPIIGLGCSSFANNFVENEADIDIELTMTQDTAGCLSPNHPKVQEWISTIKHAVNKGINLLDTAPWYGHGSSEVVIGFALKEMELDRSKLIINTKIGRYDSDPLKQFDFSYAMTIRSVKRSLDRMGCGYIDVLQLHDPEFSPSIELILQETIPAMIECKKRGWVKALGMTGYPLELHYDILTRAGKGTFDQTLTYGHFNLHNQNLCTLALGNNDSTMSFMEYCQVSSVALMAAAPLSMGLLTHNSPPFWHPASETLKTACKHAAEIAKKNNVDLPMLAILFALAHDGISCTLLGMGCQRDLDSAIIAVERYRAIHAGHDNIETLPPTCNGVMDHGVALRSQMQSKLNPILTESEKRTLAIILDDTNGPFSDLWKEQKQSWDGLYEADLFWSKVPGGRSEAESKMRKSSSRTNAITSNK